MSKQLNRKVLKVNNRTNVKSEFLYNPTTGYKSVAEPSIVTWRGPGKGTKGESTNSGDLGSKQIINRNWKAI
jgi:hypothetical protein